jgi:hypothetical protein
MTSITSITYEPNPKKPTAGERWDNAHYFFGFYHVRYDDGFRVSLPHSGWLNTISEDPLDLEDAEHRATIERIANEIRAEQLGP